MKTTDITEKMVESGASQVTDAEIREVNERAAEIEKKFHSKNMLSRFVEDARLLLGLVKDYWSKNYRQVPYWVIGAVVFSLLYVLNPLDLAPDAIPIIGLMDDTAVLGICLKLIEKDLLKYKQWKELGGKTLKMA